MAQKDYVARGRSSARRKTSKGKAKKAQGLPMTTLVVAVGIVVLFVGGLFYITQNKKESPQSTGSHSSSAPVDTLPPKPEERWRYIKELERRGVDTPNIEQTQKSTGSNIMRPSELTPEQRQLLEQIDSDRRGPVTNLPEVPYNGQPVPRSQVIIKEPTQPVNPPVQRKPVTSTEAKTENRPVQSTQPAPVESKPANNLQNMLVQCGFFPYRGTSRVRSCYTRFCWHREPSHCWRRLASYRTWPLFQVNGRKNARSCKRCWCLRLYSSCLWGLKNTIPSPMYCFNVLSRAAITAFCLLQVTCLRRLVT
ncbi:Cell division protein FtsN [Providencia stuartii]|nr:Cell division protein FtsN [Providencia stuartii]